MSDKCDWIYARVLRKGNLIFPRQPYWLGWVEFTPPRLLDPHLSSAVATSLTGYSLAPIEKDDRQHVIARTLVINESRKAAMSEGEVRIQEAIEVFRTRVSLLGDDFFLSPAGALLDIVGDTVRPLLPPAAGRGLQTTVALFDDRAVHPQYTLNLLLAAPNGFGGLGVAYLRSLHWKQLASRATTAAEKVLLFWMATEALCSVTVGADPVPNLMHVTGFPIGRRARLALPLKAVVRNHGIWTKRIHKLLNTTKKTRNSIVHEGYRDFDIRQRVASPDERDALLFLSKAATCLHEHAEEVLQAGAAPLSRLWEDGRVTLASMEQSAAWIVDHLEGKYSSHDL